MTCFLCLSTSPAGALGSLLAEQHQPSDTTLCCNIYGSFGGQVQDTAHQIHWSGELVAVPG